MTTIINSAQDGATGQIQSKIDESFDIYFRIHQKVNARNEEIQKSYKNNIIVNFNDVIELHQKTIQSINSLKPVIASINIRISVSHNEGESEKFNTFEAFEKHNTTSPNPISVVNFIYSFTIFDVENKSFENYKITNQLRSRIAEIKQMEAEAPPFFPRSILNNIATTTAKISVEYSDYVKARHFTATFDEWIKSCDETQSSKFIHGLKKHSHHIPPIGKIIIYATLAIFTINALEKGSINSELELKFLIIYSAFFIICGMIANFFLRKIEESIDSNTAISYLNINKGDGKLWTEFNTKNKKSFSSALIGAVGTIAIGVITKLAYDMIKWIIS